MEKLVRIFLLLIILVLISTCSLTNIKERKKALRVINKEIIIKGLQSYEECIEVYPGEILEYDFEASDFVNFNIHYHTEENIYHPVLKEGIMWMKGAIDPEKHAFYTEEQENYCLTWENLETERVRVSLHCKIKKKL